jgi:Predicted hydrolase (metallo-beta-lactamase superfamily)
MKTVKGSKKSIKGKKKVNNKKISAAGAIILIIIIGAFAALYFSGVIDLNLPEDNRLGNDIPAGTSEGDLLVYFLDVGQGDSIVLRFPDGVDMIIDAGNGTSASQAEISDYLSRLAALNIDKFDYMLATHFDSDHINMLDDVLVAYEVDNIYYNDYDGGSATYNKFIQFSEAEGANITEFDSDGDAYTIDGQGYTVTIYAPGYGRFTDENSMSPITVVTFAGRRVILTGDAEAETEEWFLTEVLGGGGFDSDVLKVGHHGSATSSSAAFLDVIDCEYAVISCGAGNSYGHPKQATLDKLSARNTTVYRTDLQGTVTLTIDAEGNISFTTEK